MIAHGIDTYGPESNDLEGELFMIDDIIIQVKIRGRMLSIPFNNGLSPLEISTITNQVVKKITDIEENNQTMDGSKMGIVVAFEFATELHNLKKNAGMDK